MTQEEQNVDYHRLLEEDRIRQVLAVKTEKELVGLIRVSIAELEAAADRLEHMLSFPREDRNAG